MLFTAMPNRNKVPMRLLLLSLKGTENGLGTAQNSSAVLKVGHCPFFNAWWWRPVNAEPREH